MSAWSGDIGELGQLAENLAELARVPSRAARTAAGKIARLIDREFTTETDPDGDPWEPLAESTVEKKSGDERILQETEKLRRGIRVRPMARAGISITSEAEYLGFHQGKGSPRANIPPRHVLPEGELPDAWERAIGRAIDDEFDRAVGRG